MKQSIIGSDNKLYDISYFTVSATKELCYQVREKDLKHYKQLVMASPYKPEFYINDLIEALRVDAPGTIESIKRK
jgi:hypothetical protein